MGRSRATLQTWFGTYLQSGVAEWRKDLEAGRWRSGPQLQRWLVQTRGVKLALSSLYDRLGKVRARRRVPRPSHV